MMPYTQDVLADFRNGTSYGNLKACLDEVRSAVHGIEVAIENHIKASEVKVIEAQMIAREATDTRNAAQADTAALRKAQAEAEARIQLLEEKLQRKRKEIAVLKTRMDDVKAAVSTGLAEGADNAHGDEVSKRRRTPSEDEREKERRRGQDGEGLEERNLCVRESRALVEVVPRHGVSPSTGGSAGSEPPSERRKAARAKVKSRERRSRPRRTHRRQRQPSHSSEESADECSEDDGRESGRSESAESQMGGEPRRVRRASGSRGRRRSRSPRPPWRPSGRDVPLCIPFVTSHCAWGDKCRERHPDPEDCRQARESLLNKVCRFGVNCKRRDCIFKHPDGKRTDS